MKWSETPVTWNSQSRTLNPGISHYLGSIALVSLTRAPRHLVDMNNPRNFIPSLLGRKSNILGRQSDCCSGFSRSHSTFRLIAIGSLLFLLLA
ncbi:hypothetical protein L484_016543 [Morus notabilis]|uniref:Uncharacterized protein n=1 Tax=Morus notabilis TaxID=981085 RepID=W9R6G6_9ROSA|nr:hypothetical protein L484_016543 [Morus notabilis]